MLSESRPHLVLELFLLTLVWRHKEGKDIKEVYVIVSEPQCVAVEKTVCEMPAYGIVLAVMVFAEVHPGVGIVVVWVDF